MTCLVYLIVAFKDPGYVTSYVLRGDDIEDEIEKMRIYEDQKNKNNINTSLDQSRIKKHKIKRVNIIMF